MDRTCDKEFDDACKEVQDVLDQIKGKQKSKIIGNIPFSMTKIKDNEMKNDKDKKYCILSFKKT